MYYKLFNYRIERNELTIDPDRHYRLFRQATGADRGGNFATYRGRQDAVLMHVRPARGLFMGLIGKHSTEREVTEYDQDHDSTKIKVAVDDDYPHTPFICSPRLARQSGLCGLITDQRKGGHGASSCNHGPSYWRLIFRTVG